MQELDALAEYVPAEQLMQLDDADEPVELRYLPAEQELQLVDPAIV